MPYQVTAPTTREHLSFSQLQVAADCGEAYRRRYIEGESLGALTVPAVAGSAFHEAMLPFEMSASIAGAIGDEERATEVLTRLVRRAINEEMRERGINSEELFQYGNMDLGYYIREKVPKWANLYVKRRLVEEEELDFRWVEDDPQKSIELECLVEVAGHPFLSFIDQVFYDSEGRLVIRDLKTGKPKPGHVAQMEQYRVALKRAFGLEAAYGQLLYLKGSDEPFIQVVDFQLTDNEVERMVGRLLRVVGEGVFIINGPFTGACENCEFRMDCPWGRARVHGNS